MVNVRVGFVESVILLLKNAHKKGKWDRCLSLKKRSN
jgi:hypothetical protein